MFRHENDDKPIRKRMTPGAAWSVFWERVLNTAPNKDSGKVREAGQNSELWIPMDPIRTTLDTDVFDASKIIQEPTWSAEALEVGFRAFNDAVMEGAEQVRASGLFDQELWETIRGKGTTIETVVMKGQLNAYPIGRVSALEAWEKFGQGIPIGQIPIMMAKSKYGKEEALWRVGAGKDCGMAILVSDDRSLRKQWIDAVTTGLDAHWPGMIVGAVLSENVWEPVKNLDHNREILPILGESAKKAMADFRSGKGYPGKRILIADMGRVGRANPSLVGEVTAAAREGKESGNVGVIATMSVGDYVAWQRAPERFWNRALLGAGVFAGGFTDMDAAEMTARAFSRTNNPEMARKLMGLEDTRVAMLAGVREEDMVEGWILGKRGE